MSLGIGGITAVFLLGLVLILYNRNTARRRLAGQPPADNGKVFSECGDEPRCGSAGSGEVGTLSSIIVATLAAQKAFVSLGTDDLPERAKDDFSIGYIGGYVDAILHRKGVESQQAGQTIAEIVLSAIFNGENGPDLYERYLTMQQDGNTAVFAGINVADADVVAWVKDNVNIPVGWSDHVHGRP